MLYRFESLLLRNPDLIAQPMISISSTEIEQWRAELADYPAVLRSLDEIEACEGDVEDAAINLAIQANLEPNTCDRWLASFAKQFRPWVCQPDFQASLTPGDVVNLTRHLAAESTCPDVLVLPVAVQVMASGIEYFCSGS
jgi:hypothetical protein